MWLKNKIAQYKNYKSGVRHCTFDPNGPGVVRIHLVPPRFRLFGNAPYIVILNGYYLLPIGYSWAVLLSAFIDEVNKYDGKPIDEAAVSDITESTLSAAKAVYPGISRGELLCDLNEILRVLFAVARRSDPEIEIERLSIRSYSKNMTAPHRVDLMVSAMTDENGVWKCNQKCAFCYAGGQKLASSKELSSDDWKKIIDKLWSAGVPMVTFTGGEPTLREDIAELIGYAKRFVTRLNTNGIKLTPELAHRLRAAGLDSVQITLYSHDEKTHNALVGAERFSDTVNGIKNALLAGLDVSVNTPLCTSNSDYVKTLEFIHALGVRFATVSGLILTGKASGGHTAADLGEDELYRAVCEAKSFCDKNGMEMDFTSPGLIAAEKLYAIGMNVPSCGAALSNMAIAPNGTAVPCQSWLSEQGSLGSILDSRFSDIWNSELCKRLRAMSGTEALRCPFRDEKGK